MRKHNANDIGKLGEDAAVHYLRRNGYAILHRNYRNKIGEIDIIAADGGSLVFVEVKTRTSSVAGEPYEAVGKEKQKKLKSVIECFLCSPTGARALRAASLIRVDVISIMADGSESVRP